jgi:hypothetical protein
MKISLNTPKNYKTDANGINKCLVFKREVGRETAVAERKMLVCIEKLALDEQTMSQKQMQSSQTKSR